MGIIINNKLDWNSQIHVCTKLSRSIAILNKVKLKLNSKALVLLYNSFFNSHLYYCAHIWGNTYSSNLLKINILQKIALRCIYIIMN